MANKGKRLSCGVLIIDDNNNLLMQHVRGPKHGATEHWDIPKGGQKEFETPQQTAIRELHEETGIIAEEKDLIDIGWYTYNPYKDIYLFLLRVNNINIRKLHVMESKQNRDYGFVDEYRMIPWNECSRYMCMSLEYLYLSEMRREVEIEINRFQGSGHTPSYSELMTA